MKKIVDNSDRRRYAIGDVHGCFEEMISAINWCKTDADRDGVEAEIILLGDIVDKGPESRTVIEYLLKFEQTKAFRLTTLKGNHDDMLCKIWKDPNFYLVNTWWQHGGQQTLMSYGWHPLTDRRPGNLKTYIPAEHIDFLDQLPHMYETEDQIFVHAGLKPGVPMHEQTEHDAMWIRGPFLSTPYDHGRPVVHGHAPDSKNPLISKYRIGLDTACFGTGNLAVAAFDLGERIPRTAVIRKDSVQEIPHGQNVLTL